MDETNRKYCVRIRDGEHGRMWYAGKVGEVFIVNISENPSAGYIVVSDDANRVRVIEKDHAELVGPVGDFEREDTQEAVESETAVTNDDDHTIALAKAVAHLRREVDTITTNVQTFAETATSANYKAGQALTTSELFADRLDALELLADDYDTLVVDTVCQSGKTEAFFDRVKLLEGNTEMLTDAVCMLDERTQPLTSEGISELSTELTDVVRRTVTEAMRND